MEEKGEHYRTLLIRCLKDEASAEDMARAFEWIESSAGNREYFEQLRESWVALALDRPVDPGQQRHAWQKLSQRIRESREMPVSSTIPSVQSSIKPVVYKKPGDMFRLIPARWTRFAAAVFFAFVIGGLATGIYLNNLLHDKSEDEYFSVETPRGAKTTLTLTDGSQVLLNAGSRLKYPKSYNLENRDVYLEGEGYFIVRASDRLPFQVHTSGVVVRALGTEFNVKAYPEDQRIETTLVKGSVSIARSGSGNTSSGIILQPNQRASFYFNNFEVSEVGDTSPANTLDPVQAISKPVRVRTETGINTEVATSWKESRWIFERENLASLVQKLERQYDISIQIRDPELLDYHLSGTLEEESIEQVMKALQLALPIDFRIQHKEVILSINKSKINNYRHLLK